MSTREETDKIVDLIEQVNKLIHMKHHELASKNNLSLDQFHLLVHLKKRKKDNQNPTIGDIAKRSNRAQNTISERVTRLEERGLLRRIKDENDRRISRVAMTEEGVKLLDSINYQASKKFIFKALSKIEHEITDGLLNGLEQLVDKLQDKKGDIHD
ncbi:MarR family winged helix-turn-helix transcriptional regulator [Sporosalibacterium faouarense]|uniref:MarR family winged helix-turn-helix transcriptional regulator n=1 Tax=Sporosalibacterium faouarense TaxID=516123 RepID=UPI00192C7368|nr:MarR family transcriptional regulator [Sporosalibacterium faouarense]